MEGKIVYLNVLDFSEYPGPRYNSQGPDSGELFYVDKLNPLFSECVQNGDTLSVNLDGTAGFASSFLDEAFGQLTYDFGAELVLKILFQSDDEPEWPTMIREETIPQWEKRRQAHQVPHATMKYSVDCLNDNNEIVKRNAHESV